MLLQTTRDLVFIGLQEGVGKKSEKPYRFIKVADPVSFENFQLSADPNKQFVGFDKGEKVRLKIDLVDFFGNTNMIITDIIPSAHFEKMNK